MSENFQKILLYVLKASIFLTCFTLFILLMLDTWDNFTKEMTTIGVTLIKDPQIGPFLPCITVCPWSAYRKHGFYYKQKDYDDNTFNLSEIIRDRALDDDELEIDPVETMFLGKCYKVHYNSTKSRLRMPFKRQSLTLYLHEPGDEMWISGGIIHGGIIPVFVEDSKDVAAAEVVLSQKRTTYLSTKLNPCSLSLNAKYEYNQCIQNNFCAKTKNSLNNSCAMPGVKLFIGPDCNIPDCPNKATAKKSYQFFYEEFSMAQMVNIKNDCVRPCLEIGYGFSFRYFNRNSLTDEMNTTNAPDSSIGFETYFTTDLIEERTETLIYDKTTFWSSIGGNLGLFLGFSCFSVALALLKITFKYVKKVLKPF